MRPGWLSWVAVAIGLWMAPAPATAIDIQEIVSPGGIEAWLVEEHSIPIIAIEVAFRGGTALDPEGREGTANMVSGMLDEGAGDMDSLSFQKRVEDLAIRLGFDADRDYFLASMRTLSENREAAFALFGLALGKPRFDSLALERIRGQILTGLAAREEDPNSIAGRRFNAVMFAGHPYGRPGEGTPQSVAAIGADDLRAYAGARFARDNMTIAVVGDIDARSLGDMLDRAFAGLPEEAAPFHIAEFKPRVPAGIEVLRRPLPQSVILFGHAGIKRDDPDWYSALVMNYILGGGGFSSRLMQEIREKRGLAYSVSSSLRPFERSSLFAGGAGTENAKAAVTISLICDEIARLRRDGVGAAELADAKTYLTGSYPLNFGSSGRIAGQLVSIQLNRLGVDYIDRRNSYIDAVTTDSIKRVAGRLLRPDKLFWVVVGDPEGVESSHE